LALAPGFYILENTTISGGGENISKVILGKKIKTGREKEGKCKRK
jgi:hypothetical protein